MLSLCCRFKSTLGPGCRRRSFRIWRGPELSVLSAILLTMNALAILPEEQISTEKRLRGKPSMAEQAVLTQPAIQVESLDLFYGEKASPVRCFHGCAGKYRDRIHRAIRLREIHVAANLEPHERSDLPEGGPRSIRLYGEDIYEIIQG